MQTQPVPNIDLYSMEVLAKDKKKLTGSKILINGLFLVLEHLVYLFIFIVLYRWRVNWEVSFFNLDTWIYIPQYAVLFLSIHLIYSFILYERGFYKLFRRNSLVDDLFLILKSVFLAFMVAIGFLFITQTSIIFSRIIIIIYFFSLVFLSILFRALKQRLVSLITRRTSIKRNVLIIGAGRVGDQIAQSIKRYKGTAHTFVGYLDDFKTSEEVVGKLDDIESIIKNMKISEIYITIPSERDVVNRIITVTRKYEIETKVIPEMYNLIASSLKFQNDAIFPHLEIVNSPLKGLNALMKRVIDISLSTVGLMIIFPLLLIVALLIKLDSKGPVFFKQKRIGRNGIPFYMYKFRSMVVDAEELKVKLASLNEASGPVFKIKNDPRITRVGKYLRKYSIDELPQLINVIKGEMSLIGPRPALPVEVQQYNEYQWRRLEVRPGLSGLWQVSGRSDLDFDEWVNLDVYYIENWSVSLDIKILLKTIPTVLFSKGAY